MKLGELKPEKGSVKRRKRVGRGGSHQKTCCRGENGQNSRSGGGKPPGFEGGQTPWYRRLPKYKGFNNYNKKEYQEVTLWDLSAFAKNDVVTPDELLKRNIIEYAGMPVKLLATGKIEIPLEVKLHKFSKAAKESIEKAGGKTEVIK